MSQLKYKAEKQLEEFRLELEQMETSGERKRGALLRFGDAYANIAQFVGKVKSHQARRLDALRRLEALMGAERGYV
jgi:hypothetical protein